MKVWENIKFTLKTMVIFRFCLFDCAGQWNDIYVISVLVVIQKSPKQPFFARILWLSMKGIILRDTQLFACFVNIFENIPPLSEIIFVLLQAYLLIL